MLAIKGYLESWVWNTQPQKEISEEEFVMVEPEEAGLSVALPELAPNKELEKLIFNENVTPKDLTFSFPKNRTPFQTVLAPFYDNPENITKNTVLEFITAYNETYPKSDKWDVEAIDLDKDPLSELMRVVGSMIIRGEDMLLRGVSHYNLYSFSLAQKVVKHQQDPTLTAGDIAYQRQILGLFAHVMKH